VLMEHLLRKRDAVLDLMRTGEPRSLVSTEPGAT
jgi:hypothetical protein